MDKKNEFSNWIESIGLGHHLATFVSNEIDFDVLLEISEDELDKIGLPLGARKRLLKALVDTRPSNAGSSEATVIPSPHSQAQRRQVTVLFFDLADSTTLSTRLDPEDLREIISNFQSTIAAVIEQHDGFIARYMGDGLLCYFGWPKAQEDAAVRAVRSALQAQNKVAELPYVLSKPLMARAGVATGEVVVGDLIGKGASEEEAIIGQTPNLAARLQGLAEPGQVIISEATLSLLGQNFETSALDPVSLKGFDELHFASLVSSERTGSTRFALEEPNELPIIGRDQELNLLRSRWGQACVGEGQCVLLSGEAGIGKSRIVSALLELERLQQKTMVLQCSPFHKNTALWPVINYLNAKINFEKNSTETDQIEQLRRLLGEKPLPMKHVLALADLLGLELQAARHQELAPQDKRKLILSTLLQWLENTGKSARVVIIEDAHWIDSTTLDLLQQMLDRLERSALMLLITSRPENCPQLAGSSLVTQLSLNRLGRQAVCKMIDELTTRDLTDDFVQQLIDRSDGIPLYVEELARVSPSEGENVPLTLKDGLMARLDAQPNVRRIAQHAACIGRDFEFGLLECISMEQGTELQESLEQLVGSGLILNTVDGATQQYRFRHALLRDSAYESLLMRERTQIHTQIAAAMVGTCDPINSSSPEQIAIHYQLAEKSEKAFSFWIESCRRASEASAIVEAIAHGEKALAALNQVGPSKHRDELEFQLQMSYGSALQSARGFADEKVGETFARAAVLAEQLGFRKGQLLAQLNLWSYKHHSGKFVDASHLINTNFIMASKLEDKELLVQVNHAAWTTGFLFEPLPSVQEFIDTGLDSYDEDKHKLCWSRFGGHDPAVCGNGHGAWVSWLLGYPDKATEKISACLCAAERSEHKGSKLMALAQKCFLGYYSRNHESVFDSSEKLYLLASETKASAHVTAITDLLLGFAIVQTGVGDNGLKLVESAIQKLNEINTRNRQSFLALVHGEALRCVGREGQAIQVLEGGVKISEKTGEIRWKGELIRVLTSLQLEERQISPEVGETQYQQAIEHDDIYGDRMYRLRAVQDLAELLAQQNRKTEAYELLRNECKSFTQGQEGQEEPDLKEATAMLSSLLVT